MLGSIVPGGGPKSAKVAISRNNHAGLTPGVAGPPRGISPGAVANTVSSQQAGKKSVSSENDFTSSEYGVVVATIRRHTILLGETKYYYAVDDPSHADRLIIRESPTPTNGRTDVTFADPEKIEGDKVGVYWEYMDAAGNDLKKTKPGSIRLVGRYWEKEKAYKVRLIANAPGRAGKIDIEVKKPRLLGNPNLSDIARHSVVTDVFGTTNVNLDSLIIRCAGKYGVPPQLIKGQIEHESSFAPKYRYEPGKDIEYQTNPDAKKRYFGAGNNFVVVAGGSSPMGGGPGIPQSHTNIPPIGEYVGSPMTIRSYVAQNPGQYIRKKERKFIYVYDDATLSSEWQSIFRELRRNQPKLSENDAIKQSLASTMDTFKRGDFGDKAYDSTAQTRIMASYGFLQLTHYNTTDLTLFGFTKTSASQPPEFLNDQSYNFPAYGERMTKKLKDEIGDALPPSQWKSGYEKTWLNVLETYNPGETGYNAAVFQASGNYKPSSGE